MDILLQARYFPSRSPTPNRWDFFFVPRVSWSDYRVEGRLPIPSVNIAPQSFSQGKITSLPPDLRGPPRDYDITTPAAGTEVENNSVPGTRGKPTIRPFPWKQ